MIQISSRESILSESKVLESGFVHSSYQEDDTLSFNESDLPNVDSSRAALLGSAGLGSSAE